MQSQLKEDTVSQTSASSSGIPNCVVTILGHDSIRSKIKDVEKKLKDKGYTVAFPVAAGRPKVDNLISRVKHAAVTIIILNKQTAKTFQATLDVLPPQPNAGSLDTSSTLILCEEGLSRIRKAFRNIVRLRLGNDANKIAVQITSFIEAHNMSERNGISDPTLFKEFHTDLLLHSIINPLRSKELFKLSLKELEDLFQHRYNNFCHVLVQDTSLNEYVGNRSGFSIKNGIVTQTDVGALQAHEWYLGVENPLRMRSSSNLGTRNDLACVPGLLDALPEGEEPSQAAQARANQWVSGNETTNVAPAVSDSLNIDLEKTEKLRKYLYEFDSRYSFFLISGKSTPPDTFGGVANIPWLRVVDFDVNSRENGLLSSVEGLMENYSISTAYDVPKALLNEKTDWFFPLGFSSKSDTIVKDSPLRWFSSFKDRLEKQCLDMANFCALRTMPVFLILWYDEEEKNVKYLDRFLSILHPAFKSDTLEKRIILCSKSKPIRDSLLSHLISDYELTETTIEIDPLDVFKWLAYVEVPKRSSRTSVRLPKAKDEENVDQDRDIVEIPKENVWIRDYIELLSLESQNEIAQRKTNNLGQDFVKGGTITWDELAADTITVQREVKKEIFTCLQTDVLEEKKSIVIKILHAPGGGGTTFARQLLWDLHTKVPCGVVVPNLTLSVTQVMESVQFIHDHTLLPFVLLVDGRSNYEVEQLYENCKYAIVILHVQRYNADIPKAKYHVSSRTCHLPGSVTSPEAVSLKNIFSTFAPGSVETLSALTEDVIKKTKKRFIFEYGLAAFNHEFKGVRKYVHGYLKVQSHTEKLSNLLPWQNVVAYLSLVLYYGQSGLHREAFHNLLIEGQNKKFVTLQDLPHPGRQFILESKEMWKISYNIVAKEILEQILAPSTNLDVSGDMELSKSARKNLHELVINFIIMIKNAAKGNTSESVINILMSMIIRRDYIEMDVNDGYSRRCRLSRLLEHVPVKDNRIKILRQLTHTFPKNAEFHAHLGRLLNIMERFDEAEKSLQTALEIRKKERVGTDPDWSDNVLGRIHHMCGFGYLCQAKNELSAAIRTSSPEKLIRHVKDAINHFSAIRKYATHNLSYGYIGEVRSRLLISEYVHQKFRNGCRRAFDDQLGKEHLKLCELVREAHSVCDQLLAECRQHTPDVELKRLSDYSNCVETFNDCFSDIRGDIPLWNKTEANIPFRRSQIVSLKMMHKRNGNMQLLCNDDVSVKKDIIEIIKLHEKTLGETFSNNLLYVSISHDALEWLDAIRHRLADDKYTLNKVLEIVTEWERRNEAGFATFYLYVLNFVSALFSPGKDISNSYNNASKELKEKLQAKRHWQRMPYWRLEWLAKHNNLTIRRLINRSKLGSWDKDSRFWKDPESVQKLQVCTGTVVKSSLPLRGNISVDVSFPRHKNRVEVYFVPKLYHLCGSRYADKSLRVEFCIGFSPWHGAEAFKIIPMEKKLCTHCKVPTEVLTINGGKNGRCASCRKLFGPL